MPRTDMRTLYDLMMLSPQADREVITVVYRHLAKRFHPDKDPSPRAEARMMELNEAYAVLSDREKRARYDEVIGVVSPRASSESAASGTPRPASVPEDPHGEAGPAPTSPEPVGSVMTFGRYRGWALNQVERYDRDYIEWLSRTTMGRNYRLELEQLLRRRG